MPVHVRLPPGLGMGMPSEAPSFGRSVSHQPETTPLNTVQRAAKASADRRLALSRSTSETVRPHPDRGAIDEDGPDSARGTSRRDPPSLPAEVTRMVRKWEGGMRAQTMPGGADAIVSTGMLGDEVELPDVATVSVSESEGPRHRRSRRGGRDSGGVRNGHARYDTATSDDLATTTDDDLSLAFGSDSSSVASSVYSASHMRGESGGSFGSFSMGFTSGDEYDSFTEALQRLRTVAERRGGGGFGPVSEGDDDDDSEDLAPALDAYKDLCGSIGARDATALATAGSGADVAAAAAAAATAATTGMVAAYDALRLAVLRKATWKQKALFRHLDAKIASMAAVDSRATSSGRVVSGVRGGGTRAQSVVIVGAGPVGLRTAVELALLGHAVTVLEKRDSFTRNNVLHLWAWVARDLVSLGIRASVPKFALGPLTHISTRRLQTHLTKVALLLGVRIVPNATFRTAVPVDDGSWIARCVALAPPGGRPGAGAGTGSGTGAGTASATLAPAADLGPFHIEGVTVVLGAGGALDPIGAGFQRRSQRLTQALGLVAHFTNGHTKAENAVSQRALASQFHPALFAELRDSRGADLENLVLFRNEDVHYFVMTPSKASLLASGVLRADVRGPALTARGNIDASAMRAFAKRVATFIGLPESCEFADDQPGAVGIFDFSTRSRCLEALQAHAHPLASTAASSESSESSAVAAAVVGGHGSVPLLLGVVGDALMEPFWPEGLGINRGFLGALDTVWALHRASQSTDAAAYAGAGGTAADARARTRRSAGGSEAGGDGGAGLTLDTILDHRHQCLEAMASVSGFSRGRLRKDDKDHPFSVDPRTRYTIMPALM